MEEPKCTDCGKESFACWETITDRKIRCMDCRSKHLHGVMDKARERAEERHRDKLWALREFLRR